MRLCPGARKRWGFADSWWGGVGSKGCRAPEEYEIREKAGPIAGVLGGEQECVHPGNVKRPREG